MKAPVADIAALVMRELGKTVIGPNDAAALDLIADRAGFRVRKGVSAERRRTRVIEALQEAPGALVVTQVAFFLPEETAVAPPDIKPRRSFGDFSPEEKKRVGRLGGLAGNHKKKGFASMSPERQRAIARMGAAARKTRHVFSREERVISNRMVSTGETKEQATAYAAQAIRAATPEQRLAIVATSEADAITDIATAAGRKVQPAPATQQQAPPPPATGMQPVPASERDPALLAQLEADLATARSIKDKGQRELFQIETSLKLAAATEARHAAKRAKLQAKRDARVDAALQRRADLGFDNTEILASLGQKQKSD